MRTHLRVALFLLLAVINARAASLYEIPLQTIEGKSTTLAPYRGQVLLIVNVASECGYTPQYAGLQAVYSKYQPRGFAVLGFPCNQFGEQEPGSNAEIRTFCTTRFQVTFPLFAKLDVNGSKRHDLYRLLAGPDSPFPGNIKWNFGKFLVGRDGRILQRFESGAEPDSPEVIRAIEAALAAKSP